MGKPKSRTRRLVTFAAEFATGLAIFFFLLGVR